MLVEARRFHLFPESSSIAPFSSCTVYCIRLIPVLLGLQVHKLPFCSRVHDVCAGARVLCVVTVMPAYCILKVLHEDSFNLRNQLMWCCAKTAL